MPLSNTCWGLDIGAGEIKAIKLHRLDESNVEVEEFTTIEHKRVLSTPGLDIGEVLRISLGELMSRFGEDLRKNRVAVSVAGHQAFARFAKLPPVEKEKEVANLIRFEAVQQIPFPIEQVEWDYQVFANDDQPDVEVGIFAITKDRVNETLARYSEAGIGAGVVTLSPVAAFNAISYDLSFTPETEGTVILDVGVEATDLIIAEGGRVWIRTFPLGGHRFTEALAEAFKLDYPKAEKLKRTAETSKYKKHVFQALQPVLTDLIGDVQRSIEYYRGTHANAKLTRLIGLGSTFKLLGMRKLLEQSVGMRVQRLEGFRRISVEGPEASRFEASALNMATAYGLALQGVGLTPIAANLMPVEILRERTWKSKTPWFVAASLALLAAGGLTFLRPAMASVGWRPVAEKYPEVRTTIRNAKEEQNAWRDAEQATLPSYLVTNAFMLLDRKDFVPLLLKDVADLNASASSALSDAQRSQGGPLAFDLQRLTMSYIPPGQPLDASTQPSAGLPNQRGGAGANQAAGTVAEQFGAMRLEVTLDSPHDLRLPFIQNEVLEWFKSNAEPKGRPYRIVREINGEAQFEIDRVEFEDVSVDTPPERGGSGAGPQRNFGPSGGGIVPRGGGTPEDLRRGGEEDWNRGGERDDRRAAPNPRGRSGVDGDLRELEQLAPLADAVGVVKYAGREAVKRLTVVWYVQFLEPTSSAPDGTAGLPAPDREQEAG